MESKPTRKPPLKWHAVTVVLQTSSCAAAAMCRATRFLSNEAPRLPLTGCDHPETCECKYRHYQDRRSGARRAEVGDWLYNVALTVYVFDRTHSAAPQHDNAALHH